MRSLLLTFLICLLSSCTKTKEPPMHQKKTICMNLRKEPISLDPRKGNDIVASQVHFMLFEGLLRLNPDMSLSLAQAESYEISRDKKIYTFHLKDTIWSDNTPVTAYDFERAWKSMLDPEFSAPDAYLLYMIKNAKLVKQGQLPLDLVGIYAKDAHTLMVELETPFPYFLQIVASSVYLPVHAAMDLKDPNWATHLDHILSNGPFTLKEWKFNEHLVFEKNPLYQRANEVDLDQISFNFIEEEMAVLHLYDTGHFDLVGTPVSFSPSAIHDNPSKVASLTFFPVANSKFLAFNTASFPFMNANIRRAFSYAIDRNSIVGQITRLHEKAAFNVIPPVLLPEAGTYFSDADSVKAKEYLKKGLEELQIEELGPIHFMYMQSELNHTLVQELHQMWAKNLGITVNLERVELKVLHERSKKGDFSIGIFAWVADYSDPMNILERFTDKTNHRNYSKWENNDYNDLIRAAYLETSSGKYLEKIKRAEQFLIDEMPITCLFHESYSFLIHPHVKGFAISPLGHIYFDKIFIESKN